MANIYNNCTECSLYIWSCIFRLGPSTLSLIFSMGKQNIPLLPCSCVFLCGDVECQKVSVPIRPPHLIDQVISRSIAFWFFFIPSSVYYYNYAKEKTICSNFVNIQKLSINMFSSQILVVAHFKPCKWQFYASHWI